MGSDEEGADREGTPRGIETVEGEAGTWVG